MNHTATTSPASDATDSAVAPGSLANPRRIRLGADGRPITGTATSSRD